MRSMNSMDVAISGILGDGACQTPFRGASSRSWGPAHAAGSGLAAKFQYPVPFLAAFLCFQMGNVFRAGRGALQ